MRRRVVITGVGVVSCAGRDASLLSSAVAGAKSCLWPLNDGSGRYAGRIPDFPGADAFEDLSDVSELDRYVLLALVAAGQALKQAGLDPRVLGGRMGLFAATCSGPMPSIEAHYAACLAGCATLSSAGRFALSYASAARVLAARFGIAGFNGTITTACSASVCALGIACDFIRLGLLDAALVGGSDAYSPSTQAGFDGLKATCAGACAPFSKPIGLCLGEAGAFIVLEERDHALARDAIILDEILGFGTSNDAYHCSSPDPSGNGQYLAICRALDDAGLKPDAIGYISAHGTGTLANDKTETRAVLKALGDSARNVPISSAKAVVGHCLGAAGVLETISTLLCAGSGALPPTASFVESREGCTLDYVPASGRPWPIGRPWLKNSFAFGGNNAVAVLGPGAGHADSSIANDIVVSAIGLVTPAGTGRDSFLAALEAGIPLMTDRLDADGHLTRICAAQEPDAVVLSRRLDLRGMDAPSRHMTAASHLALVLAGISGKREVRGDVGFFLGLATASTPAEADFLNDYFEHNSQVRHIMRFPYVVPNSIAGDVCRALSLTGHNTTMCFGPGAGLMNLAVAAVSIRAGHAESIVTGAVDFLTARELANRRLAGEACALPGEAAVAFVLESATVAVRRGAKPIARVLGMGWATDTGEPMAAPSDSAFCAAVRDALANAALAPDAVDAICGLTDPDRDRAALAPLFDGRPPVVIGVAPVLGIADACGALMDLARIFEGTDHEGPKVILSAIRSQYGLNCAVVFGRV